MPPQSTKHAPLRTQGKSGLPIHRPSEQAPAIVPPVYAIAARRQGPEPTQFSEPRHHPGAAISNFGQAGDTGVAVVDAQPAFFRIA
jgi:hypothetical protein